MIYPVVHVAQDNICLGAFACVHHFHHQLRGTDTAPDKCGIENNGFHKAVLGASEHLILLRLLHSPGGIGPGVNEDAFVKAVHKQGEYAGHQAVEDFLPGVLQIHLHIRYKAFGHFMGVLRHIFRSNPHKLLQQLLHQFILAEAVDEVNAGIFPAHMDYPVNHVEILVSLQLFIQPGHI